MITFILGKPDSGKSSLAEQLVCQRADACAYPVHKIYLATMIPYGKEGQERVAKHKKARDGKGFYTIECPSELSKVRAQLKKNAPCICLLECMSNLVGNEMQKKKDATDEELLSYIMNCLSDLAAACEDLFIVGNEFPLTDEGYDEETIRYVTLIHRVNECLIAFCDKIYRYENEQWRKLP